MNFGRRAEYRVELSESADLAVSVTTSGGSPIGGQLIDVSASGAGVRFDAPNPPNLSRKTVPSSSWMSAIHIMLKNLKKALFPLPLLIVALR